MLFICLFYRIIAYYSTVVGWCQLTRFAVLRCGWGKLAFYDARLPAVGWGLGGGWDKLAFPDARLLAVKWHLGGGF